jgi:TolB-like protein/Flp pilus assembly protein TadD
MTSLFSELRRRNVFRVAMLYGVVAWLIMQVADVVMPRVGIPEWGVTLVILLLVLGFPIVVIAAWAFELTPEGLKRTGEVDRNASITPVTGQRINHLIIGVLALALVFVVIDSYVLRDEPPAAEKIEATQASASDDATARQAPPGTVGGPASDAAAPALTSIAVLPFVNMSSDAEQEYFSDGLSEELLNLLAKIEEFKVAGRTSSFAFKGKNDDLRVIAAKLGVATILEGSVRKDGDQIRVTAQLIKADDGYHLWSETYDRRLESIFAIQDEIAGEVVTALKVTLLNESEADAAGTKVALARERPTDNMEAYTSYLRGQHLIKSRIGDDMFKALREFRHAASLDPDFAEAHVGVANGYSLLASYGYRNVEEVGALAEASVERALALKPELGSAWAAKNLLAEIRGAPIEEKLPLIEKAVALSPNDPQSLSWLATDYGELLRMGDELATYEKAYALDPLSPLILYNLSLVYKMRGLDDQAERLADELEALMPDRANPYRLRARLAWFDADFVEETRWFHRAVSTNPRSVPSLLGLADNALEFGAYDASLRYARRVREISPSNIAAISNESWALRLKGRESEADAVLDQVMQLYPDDPDLIAEKAKAAYMAGDNEQFLLYMEKSAPGLFADPPEIRYGPGFWQTYSIAWALRQRGDHDRSDALLAAHAEFLRARMHNYPRSGEFWLRLQVAAVRGDVPAFEKALHEFQGRSAAFNDYLIDPMIQNYRDQPAVAVIFEEMREANRVAREQLAAEGIF